jgi:hypothetical protein
MSKVDPRRGRRASFLHEADPEDRRREPIRVEARGPDGKADLAHRDGRWEAEQRLVHGHDVEL